MKQFRRRIAAALVVALAFAMPLPVVAFAEPSATVAPAPVTPTAVTTADLKCVTMVSDTVGYAAGALGTIIKTTDGGNTWVKLTTGTTTADFRGIAFWSTTVGVAVTYDRAVYRTINGGSSWTVASADMTANQQGAPAIGLSGVTAIPGSTDGATVFGGTRPNDGLYYSEQVWRSEYNGGAFWGQQPVLAPKIHYTPDPLGNPYWSGEGEMLSVDFFDNTRGWAVGDDMFPNEDTSTVHATADGGYTWTRKIFPVALRLTGVAFGTATDGVIVSSVGRVFRSSNGGTAWTEGTGVGTTALNGVDMTSATNAWTVGAGGKILRTINGGSSWTQSTSQTTMDLAAVSFIGTRGVAVGLAGTIVVTADGATWSIAGTVPVPDTTKPTMTSLTSSTHPVQASWYSGSSATFAWSASDNIGVTGYSYVRDTSSTTRPAETTLGSAVTTTVAVPEGVSYFHVIARDAAGNWSLTPLHYEVRTDRTVPDTTDNHVASYADGIAQITLTPTDDRSGIQKTQWAVTGTAASSGTGTNVTVTGAGSYSLAYASTDNAGNKEPTATVAFSIVGMPPETVYTDIEGANRYETAVEAAKLAFPSGADTVVIATGANWPDALGGAALAGFEGAPILLTDPNTLPSAVKAEIERLGATKAYILGSEAAVSAGVASAIDAIPGMATPDRLAGSNRYATANEIAKKVKSLNVSYDGVMFVATGANFPDALAASPIAAAKGWPLYLAPATGTIPQATLDIMKARGTRVIILGSSAAVSTSVENQLKTAFPGSVLRLEGPNRYATGLAVVDYGVTSAGLSWRAPAIATGTNFPDALAGGVLQGLDGSILLLTDGTKLTPSVGAAITANKASIMEVRYLGSTAAVSAAVRTAVQDIVQ
jgi:putative cell wall-binding protein/photosystem II stability/assembly factor-like uncharacterized protein